MSLFQEMEGDTVILVNNGLYKQVKLFRRGDYLYAQYNGGFVRLMSDGATSIARMRFDFLSTDQNIARDGTGKLCLANGKSTPLDGKTLAQLTAPKE